MENKLGNLLQTLSPRERVIALCTALVLVVAIWNQLFYQPLQRRLKTLTETIAADSREYETQKQLARQLEALAVTDPNLAQRNLLQELKTRNQELTQEVEQGGKKLVPPKLMATALKDMLRRNGRLNLLKLTTLPVKPLLPEQKQVHPLYIHGLEMTFSGTYQDTLNYLLSLEQLPWHLKWETLDYKVKTYPVAETTIQTYTISFEENWLGI